MMDINIKNLVKGLFSSIFENDKQKKDINKEIKKILKTDSDLNIEYNELIKQKKEIQKKIDNLLSKNSKLQELQKQSDELNEENKLLKEDINTKLECEPTIVNDLYRYYKKKFSGKQNDDLAEVSELWVEVFDLEDK
jgi:chromosome segregation ATPase